MVPSPHIEYATAADFAELLDFLPAVFRRNQPDHPRFETLYPDLFRPTDEAMSRHAVVRADGRIVACVGMYRMTLQAGGCRIPVAAIGQVSTAAGHLGRGYMSALLRHQLERAREEGAALAWLSGRHDRYARFGFETAGLSFRYAADRRSAEGIPRSRAVTHGPATPDALTPALFALREATVDGVIEPREQYLARFHRHDLYTPQERATGVPVTDDGQWRSDGGQRKSFLELWLATPPGASAPDAWALVVRKERSLYIEEWCGSEDGRLELFAELASDPLGIVREESIAPRRLNEGMRRHCSWMDPTSNSLALLDRDRLLEAYRPLLPAGTPEPPRDLDSPAFLRHVFGPESSPFPHLPFLLPGFSHV